MRAANPAADRAHSTGQHEPEADARGGLGAVVVAADQPLVVDVRQVGEAPDAERHEPGHHQGGRSRAAAAAHRAPAHREHQQAERDQRVAVVLAAGRDAAVGERGVGLLDQLAATAGHVDLDRAW